MRVHSNNLKISKSLVHKLKFMQSQTRDYHVHYMPKRQINHCKSYKNVVRFIKHSPCYPHNLTYPIHLALNEKKKPFPNITSNKYFQIFRQNDTLSLIYQTYTCNSNIQQFFTPCENWENCNVKKAVKEQRKN